MQEQGTKRKWRVLAAVSLLFFFVSGSTFSSLGIVLFAMAGELHWSMAEAGASFSVLGLACCLTSPLPALLMRRIGSRMTLFAAGLTLACGFGLACYSHTLWTFYAAMALLGAGFTLGANIPGVFLLAGWFPQRAARMIGIYLMFGAFGGVVAPPLVQRLVAVNGWRVHWLVMLACAAGLAVFCLVAVLDAGSGATNRSDNAPDVGSSEPRGWAYRQALATPQFLILALAMIVTQTTVTTLHSAAVPHFTRLGLTAEFTALMLSLQALLATLAKGLAGSLAERFDPRVALVGGLIVHAAGLFLLGNAKTHTLGYLFALTFGLGWGSVYLAVTVLMLRYFGRECGTTLMSTVWLLTGFAAAGPALAGLLADRFGTFAPVFDACAWLLVPIALAAWLMGTPRLRPTAAKAATPAPAA
jgi:MFS family permease